MEAATSSEKSMNVYQNRRRHIPAGTDFGTARRWCRLDDTLQAIFEKKGVTLGKGLKWLELEKNGELLVTR